MPQLRHNKHRRRISVAGNPQEPRVFDHDTTLEAKARNRVSIKLASAFFATPLNANPSAISQWAKYVAPILLFRMIRENR